MSTRPSSIRARTSSGDQPHDVRCDVHGVGVEVRCDSADVAAIVARRLAHFLAPAPEPELVIDLRTSGPGASRPAGGARVVHESPHGSVSYSDGLDELWIDYGGSGDAHCSPATGRAEIFVDRRRPEWAWVATRPLLTLCLLELLKRRGLYGLHAAAAARDGRAVLLAGPSGSGKSTAALALLVAGWSFLGDDLVFVRNTNAAASEILAFPDELDASPRTIAMFPQLGGASSWPKLAGYPKHQLDPERVHAGAIGGAAQPALVVLPRIGERNGHRVEPIEAEEMLLELVPNIVLTDRACAQEQLDQIARLAREIPGVRLSVRGSADELPALLERLLVEAAAPSS